MFAYNREENIKQRKKFEQNPDHVIELEDFRAVARTNFHKINDFVHARMKNNSNQRGKALAPSSDEFMEISSSHNGLQGFEKKTTYDLKDIKSKNVRSIS